jgi:hypothetical protein
MYRRFIATITAASIAITAMGAVPAFAGDRDTARALAAILGLAVVGKIIHDKNKDDRVRVQRHTPHHKAHKKHKQYKANKPPRYNDVKPRPLPKRVNRKLLPGECLRSFRGYNGKVRMFGRKCLRNNYRFAQSLPRHCLYTFDTPRGDRRGYDARCLRRDGYRLAHG